MKLVWNWRAVLLRAWSIRILVITAALDGASQVWFAFYDMVPRNYFVFVGIGLAVLARIIEQKSVHRDMDGNKQ